MSSTALRRHELAGTYVPLAIRPEGLARALRALHPLGFAGCNLTIPHKQQAMTIVDEVDALTKSDIVLAQRVITADDTVDVFQRGIERMGVEIIARRLCCFSNSSVAEMGWFLRLFSVASRYRIISGTVTFSLLTL